MSDSSGVSNQEPSLPSGDVPLFGVLAEYSTPQQLLAASRVVRDAGYTRWDTYTPFPVHGIDGAMGIRPTILPWIVLGAGLTGVAAGVALQWATNAFDYRWIVSGKPFWSIPANIPITFELMVLFSALTALVGMLVLNGLPHPSHPLDLKQRFLRVTDDKFFLVIQADDPSFKLEMARELLAGTSPVVVETVDEDRVTSDRLPRPLVLGLMLLVVAAAVPFGLAAKARASTSREPRFHVVPDMDFQPKMKADRANPLFDDQRATRAQVDGTVAAGELHENTAFWTGRVDGVLVTSFPEESPTSEAAVTRGRERFGVYCAPCHGLVGRGDGMVSKRAELLAEGTWTPPSDLQQDYIRTMPVGQLFETITNGVRTMPAYGPQIPAADRWNIVLYVRALQRSRATSSSDLPASQRDSLK